MTITTANGITVLTADDGMVLTSNGVCSEKVYLGIHDSQNNWIEVDASTVQDPEDSERNEILDSEALEIISDAQHMTEEEAVEYRASVDDAKTAIKILLGEE